MAGFLDAAYLVLKEQGQPMHGLEIVRVARERGMFSSRAKDDWALVRTITSHAQRDGNSRGFAIIGKGYYGLVEWGGEPRPMIANRRRRSPVPRQPSLSTPVGISFDLLEQTRRYMPPEEFRSAWGDLYDQLLAAERAKAITPLRDKELLARVREPVRRIQDFLQGRGNDAPKSEEICDWIQLCYLLGLDREGAALWQFVREEEANSWQYERTKRLAAVCRSKLGL